MSEKSEAQMHDRDYWHGLNQRYAAAGLQVVLPEDWDAINEMAIEMDATINVPRSELEDNPKAQAAAAEKVRDALRPTWLEDMFGQDGADVDIPEPAFDTRWYSEYEEGTTCLRAYVYNRLAQTYMWVPLRRYDEWKDVAETYRDEKLRCQVHCIRGCEYFTNDPSTMPLTAYVIPRGEALVILYVCPLCRDRMNDPSWTADGYAQRGPLPWYDEGPAHDSAQDVDDNPFV